MPPLRLLAGSLIVVAAGLLPAMARAQGSAPPDGGSDVKNPAGQPSEVKEKPTAGKANGENSGVSAPSSAPEKASPEKGEPSKSDASGKESSGKSSEKTDTTKSDAPKSDAPKSDGAKPESGKTNGGKTNGGKQDPDKTDKTDKKDNSADKTKNGDTNNKDSKDSKDATDVKPPRDSIKLSSEQEARVWAFVTEQHADLADVFSRLKTTDAAEYEKALRQILVTCDRLARMAKEDPERHKLELRMWRVDSRIHLLAARMTLSSADSSEAELRAALNEQVQIKLELLQLERARTDAKLKSYDVSIEKLKNGLEKEVESRLAELRREIAKANGKPDMAANPTDTPPK